QRVYAMVRAIEEAPIRGVEEIIPSYRSILIAYDPLVVGFKDLTYQVKSIEKNLSRGKILEHRRVEIPTLYGGKFGPDLDFVASLHGLTPEEVVRIHTSQDYLVYMLGFTPGFPYLGNLEEIATPRLKTPRIKVPAGSVGIAENQTGIYPIESPGGWQIIGRTPLKLFNPLRPPHFLLAAGDMVRFIPIDDRRYAELSNHGNP
ncbi:MAG: 5-oxoprolinase subunit PxpB, partial [Proteobacteria bacterium]|nr:5-oxoprolinase subunit PxpB [Pseudomonadota bacterium]